MGKKLMILSCLFIFGNPKEMDDTMEYKERLDPIDYDDEDESFRNSESRAIYNPNTVPKRIKYIENVDSVEEMDESIATTPPSSPILQIIKSRNYTRLTKSSALTSSLPFAVSIQKKGTHYATGVLVSKNWVLSSAKEFYHIRETIKLLRLRIGTVDCKRGGQIVPIKLIEIFPTYVYGEPNDDVSLLKLATPVKQYDEVHPIKWTDKDLSIFVVLYWPRIVLNGKKIPNNAPERIKYNNIRVSTQNTISWKKCSSQLQKVNVTLEKAALCLRPIQTLHSKCMSDAGAPVLSYSGLLGVTSSWVHPSCQKDPKNSPVMVTRISSPHIQTWMKAILLQKKRKTEDDHFENVIMAMGAPKRLNKH